MARGKSLKTAPVRSRGARAEPARVMPVSVSMAPKPKLSRAGKSDQAPQSSATPEVASSVTGFFDAAGRIAVGQVAERFGMSKLQLAETIGLTRETVYRAARLEAPKAQARATEMLEIVSRIVKWAGGEKQAMAWYRAEPIAAFGGRTAECLVKEGKATAVRDYLDHVAVGGFA